MLERADKEFLFSFPKDHGQHPSYQTEWWYLNGRLASEDGGDWAYHFTIFRRAFSSWSNLVLIALAMGFKSIRDMKMVKKGFARMLENQKKRRICVDGYVGHLSITNITDNQAVFFERGATSLFKTSGAHENYLDVWLKDWRLSQKSERIHLIADRNEFGINLEIAQRKEPILNGHDGLSLKGAVLGEASYHYSITSMQTSGSLKWKGCSHRVAGDSFMDREFGTSILPGTVRGWDWFGLSLNNCHEIMISIIRDTNGQLLNTSSGAVIYPDGSSMPFSADQMDVKILETWISPSTSADYPVHWIIKVPEFRIELEIRVLIKEHEIVSATSTTINYWEGPVNVTGKMNGQSVYGHGHVELVGYAESAGGKF